MSDEGPAEDAAYDLSDHLEREKLSREIRAKLVPFVRALARAAARDWLNKVANDNLSEVTQDKLKPEQE